MKIAPSTPVFALFCLALCSAPAFALHSRITGVDGETVFSEEFIRDYAAAEKAVNESKSVAPFLKLLKRYKKTEEVAELELSLGVTYGQRTGLVDPAKAVTHFTNALKYDFPEQTYVEIIMWRGNALEQLGKRNEAVEDYLRGLLACSYHDLSGGWPEHSRPKVGFDIRSNEPDEVQRARDYRRYRKRIDLQRFLIMTRYYFVEAVKRIQSRSTISDNQLVEILERISPDTSRHTLIMKLLESENKRPWP